MQTRRPAISLWMVTLLLAALAVAATPGRAAAQDQAANVPLPESAVTEQTALALWVDTEQLTPDAVRNAMERILEQLPEQTDQAQQQQMRQRVDEGLADFKAGYKAFTEAGGQGMLVLSSGGVQGADHAGQSDNGVVLFRVAPGTDPQQFSDTMNAIEDAEPTQLETYAEGWLVDSEQMAQIPETGTAEEAKAFQTLFGETNASPVRIAFRMTPELQQRLQQQLQDAAAGTGQNLLRASQGLSTAWAKVDLENGIDLLSTLRFEGEQEAGAFNSAWNGLLDQLQMQLMQMQQMMGNGGPNGGQDAVDPQAIRGLVDALRLEQAGDKLSSQLGDELVAKAGELAPLAQGLMMMWMMQQAQPMQQQQQPPQQPGQQPGQPPAPPRN